MTRQSPSPLTPGHTDFAQIRALARKLVTAIELYVEHPDSTQKKEYDAILDRIFGAKTSLLDALVTLTELLSSLEQSQQELAAGDACMDDNDVALVRVFLQKLAQETV